MKFDRKIFDIMPNAHGVQFNLAEVKFPTSKDVFFRSKQKETLERYQAARRFMYELDTDDWEHYFKPNNDERINSLLQNTLRAQLYEAALMFYNSVVDLSWIACYVSAEYLVYINKKAFDTDKITSIEEAYSMLRKAEGLVQNPNADDSFTYLKKVCPEFTNAINHIIDFWSYFSETPIRHNYNYLKHKGALHYTEIERLRPGPLFRFYYNAVNSPSDIRDVQKKISLVDSIEQLRQFDNQSLFPYIEVLFNMLEKIVKPSPMIL